VRLRQIRDAVVRGPYRRVVMSDVTSAGSRAGEPAALRWDGARDWVGACVAGESDPAYAGGYGRWGRAAAGGSVKGLFGDGGSRIESRQDIL
jgi:hypothetical protein